MKKTIQKIHLQNIKTIIRINLKSMNNVQISVTVKQTQTKNASHMI